MFKIKLLCIILITLIVGRIDGQQFELEVFAENLRRPVKISHAGDERLFITEKDGTIMIANPDGSLNATPYLDIRSKVNAFANERGLLGLAFHPDYHENGFFFVHYNNTQGNTVIARYTINPTDINQASPGSEEIILTIAQPFNNHNGGDLHFGSDGYLYIGMGDGGNGGDPGNRSQNPKLLLGKMLRIDVNGSLPYAIPDDNPFRNNQDTLEEIWSLGLRNPWRFSFDRLNGDMWIADVGQNTWEEINHEPAGAGGLNYGWRCYEGNASFNTDGCSSRENYTFPVHVYSNRFDTGCSITGGYVYRGENYPAFYGKYIYTDFCSGIFWSLEKVGDQWVNVQLADLDNQDYVSFGEDIHGELYVAGMSSGKIYKLIDTQCDAIKDRVLTVESISPLCVDECNGSISVIGQIDGLAIQWYDDDSTFFKTDLCAGNFDIRLTDENGCTRSISAELINPKADSLSIIIVNDTLFVVGDPMQSYIWIKDGERIETTNDPIFIPTSKGVFNVIGINADGCETISDTVEFIPTSTNNLTTGNQIRLLSNPVSGILEWYYNSSQSMQVSVLSMTGKMLIAWNEQSNPSHTYSKNIESLNPGMYILNINGHGIKFIVGK